MDSKRRVTLTVEVVHSLVGVVFGGCSPDLTRQLAATPAGRVVLHMLCAARDGHVGWHWRGVVREFASA